MKTNPIINIVVNSYDEHDYNPIRGVVIVIGKGFIGKEYFSENVQIRKKFRTLTMSDNSTKEIIKENGTTVRMLNETTSLTGLIETELWGKINVGDYLNIKDHEIMFDCANNNTLRYFRLTRFTLHSVLTGMRKEFESKKRNVTVHHHARYLNSPVVGRKFTGSESDSRKGRLVMEAKSSTSSQPLALQNRRRSFYFGNNERM